VKSILVVALILPGLGVLATVAVASRRAGMVLAMTDVAAAALWIGLAAAGGASIGRFHAPALVAAAAAATNLAGATVARRRRLERVLPVGFAVGALSAGLTLGLVDGRSGVLVATLAIVAVLVVVGERGEDIVVVAGASLIGLAWLAVGLSVLHGKTESWALPGSLPPTASASTGAALPTFACAALLIGCAVLAGAGSFRGRPVDALLLVGAMATAVRVGGAFPDAGSATGAHGGPVPWLAVGCAAAAVVAASAAPPSFAFALLALAALAGPPGNGAAAALLASAAVLCALSPIPWTVAAAVPGGIALSTSLQSQPGFVSACVALGLVGVAGLVAWRLRLSLASPMPRPTVAPVGLVATALALWLTVVPGAWAWTEPGALRNYERGALLGVAGALLLLLGGAWWSWRDAHDGRR
jgi:hypothetical protein